MTSFDPRAWLAVALEEARLGLAEGGIPIGGALFGADPEPLSGGARPGAQ